jgi:glutathione S-transferase-like protein
VYSRPARLVFTAGPDIWATSFTVADAYLYTVTRWAPRVEFDLSPFPNVKAFMERMNARPKVQEALKAELRIGSASTGARVSSRTGVGSGRKRIQRAIGHRKRRRLHLTACFNGENRRDRRSRERRVPSIVSHFARDALFSPHNPRGLPSRHERELRGARPGATRP